MEEFSFSCQARSRQHGGVSIEIFKTVDFLEAEITRELTLASHSEKKFQRKKISRLLFLDCCEQIRNLPGIARESDYLGQRHLLEFKHIFDSFAATSNLQHVGTANDMLAIDDVRREFDLLNRDQAHFYDVMREYLARYPDGLGASHGIVSCDISLVYGGSRYHFSTQSKKILMYPWINSEGHVISPRLGVLLGRMVEMSIVDRYCDGRFVVNDLIISSYLRREPDLTQCEGWSSRIRRWIKFLG
jgi:hypothetical protein